MNVHKANFNGNPNIGLFCYCTNKFCLVGKEVMEKDVDALKELLKVPIHQITICGTSLIGVFLVGNSNVVLVPEIAFESELEVLKKLGIKYSIIRSKSTALGNNIVCNDSGAIVSSEFTDSEVKSISVALGVPAKKGTIAGFDTVGSLALINSKGGIVHRDIHNDERKILEKALGLSCVPTTVNMGSPYVHSGVICNDFALAIGDISGGPEIVEAQDALGLIDQ